MSESATAMIPEPMPLFGPVQLAAAGFLARYPGRTVDAVSDGRSGTTLRVQLPLSE